MKIDKEYPATHSMSTSWYIVDEEGNVGIFDFNENGPVPRRVEQTGIEDLVLGHCEDYDKHIYLPIALSKEQIEELLDNPRKPEDVDYWDEVIIQIDIKKESKFLEYAKNADFTIDFCLSKEMGMYQISCGDSIVYASGKSATHVRLRSTLRKVLEEGIILNVYDVKNLFINDVYDSVSGKIVYEKNYDNLPYYIYRQPYWTDFLSERINVPAHPVIIDQLPEEIKRRAYRVPVCFKDTKYIQIAEWCLCVTNDDVEKITNGYRYIRLPLTDGSMGYVKTNLLPDSFYDYCSEKSKYGCEDCSNYCYTCRPLEYSANPTVMIIVSPFMEFDHQQLVKSDLIREHAIQVPYLPKVPHKHPTMHYCLLSDAKEIVSQEMLEGYYFKNYLWLEDMITLINPRVIIADAKAMSVLNQKYQIDNHQININNKNYPFYKKTEIRIYRKQIEELAKLPYQGKVIPHIISEDEMRKYEEGGL